LRAERGIFSPTFLQQTVVNTHGRYRIPAI
jgi:hypothetical protein